MPTIVGKLPTLEEQFDRIKNLHWVGDCPPDEPGAPCVNDWVFTIARACAYPMGGIPERYADRVIDLIRGELPASRGEKGDEVARAVTKAYGSAHAVGTHQPRPKADPFNSELMRENAARVPIQITTDWLIYHSPIRVDGITSAQYLDYIFNPGECVAVKISKTDRGFVYRVGDADSARRLANYIKLNIEGAWYYTCPIDGQYRKIRDGNAWRMGACYGDDRIVDWRYLLLESDIEGFEREWLNVIVQLPRVVACYTSGNISVHALVRVTANSKDEFNKVADAYKRLVVVGACPGSLTATRATRLPAVIRTDKFSYQRLLYLDPAADGPIYQT